MTLRRLCLTCLRWIMTWSARCYLSQQADMLRRSGDLQPAGSGRTRRSGTSPSSGAGAGGQVRIVGTIDLRTPPEARMARWN